MSARVRGAAIAATLLVSVSVSSAASRFPAPPPHEGMTLLCPSQAVLSMRKPTQNDMNGGGWGYYWAKINDDRSQSVRTPDKYFFEQKVSAIMQHEFNMGDDEAMAWLWGTYCAYWNEPMVKAGLERARSWYQNQTGMSGRAEMGLHTAMIDWAQVARDDQAACAIERQTPVLGLVASVACDYHEDSVTKVITSGYRHLDDGDKSLLAPGAVVAGCAALKGQTKGREEPFVDYVTYRLCMLEAAKVDESKLNDALVAAKVTPYIKWRFLTRYLRGANWIAQFTPLVAKHEAGWPNDKLYVDETLAQVSDKYMPVFDKWLGEFKAIEAWYDQLKDGPAASEGCQQRFQKALTSYVKGVLKTPKGDELLDILGDPVAFHFGEALAVCYRELEDPLHARAFASYYLKGSRRVDSYQDALWSTFAYNARDQHYKGKKISPWATSHQRIDSAREDRAWRSIDGYSANTYDFEDTVAAVKKKGDGVEVSFKTSTYKGTDYYDCVRDYGHVSSIDQFGNFHYDESCKSRQVTRHSTRGPVVVLAADAGRVKPGTTIKVISAGDTKGQHTILWVKQGKDVVWAAGVAL